MGCFLSNSSIFFLITVFVFWLHPFNLAQIILTQAIIKAIIELIFIRAFREFIKMNLILRIDLQPSYLLPKLVNALLLRVFIWFWKEFCQEEIHGLMIHNRQEHRWEFIFRCREISDNYWTILNHLFYCDQSSRLYYLCWREDCLILWCSHSYNTKIKFIHKLVSQYSLFSKKQHICLFCLVYNNLR